MSTKPDAFLSYTRFDDRRDRITDFRTGLSESVQEVSGEPFNIFQDVDDEEGITIGEPWKGKLNEVLNQARFFIPVLTPSFFRSEPCRQELRTFLDLEQKVGRRDLVLPIYWITCPVLEEGHLKAADELAQEIDERQRWDWRELLFEDLTSAACRRELHALSTQIERARRNVLRVVETVEPKIVGETTRTSTPPSKPVSSTKSEQTPPKPKPTPKKAKSVPTLWTPGEVFRDIDEPWCPEMVKIPAGTFLMGSAEDEEGRFDNEGPQHDVTISHDFALGRYPVTFEEYDYFCEATKREKPKDRGWGRGRRPVIYVSHQDAEAYCAWLTDVTKASYRLPTEAEWEYACRAGTTHAYAFGKTISDQQANFERNVNTTTEVGAYPANGWNLQDMHGNLWEWCADAPRTYGPEPVTDPEGTGTERVLRGGSWSGLARRLRSAARSASGPGERGNDVGFRCARVQE